MAKKKKLTDAEIGAILEAEKTEPAGPPSIPDPDPRAPEDNRTPEEKIRDAYRGLQELAGVLPRARTYKFRGDGYKELLIEVRPGGGAQLYFSELGGTDRQEWLECTEDLLERHLGLVSQASAELAR